MPRTALITGGASGIGAATAARLKAEGIETITADRSAGADLVLDVTDEAEIVAVARSLPHIDILVNSAGIVGANRPLWETSADDWREVLETNVIGLATMCRVLVPPMVSAGWGRIVNLASMAGKDGNPNLSSYSASKGAVIALTKSLGKELATTGVLCNAVTPALVATPMNATTAPAVVEYLTGLIPMRRMGRAEEVAELICWLCSDRCSFSTGAVFDISGGRATY